MDFAKVAQIVGIMVSPTIVIGTALHVPRLFRTLRNRHRERFADPMRPSNPPIEELAADLRRLLIRHDTLKRSTDEAMRARKLVAIEAAITDCATEAARALGVAHPDRPARGPLPVAQLRRLLQALLSAGLVLPPAVNLVTTHPRGPDSGVTRN